MKKVFLLLAALLFSASAQAQVVKLAKVEQANAAAAGVYAGKVKAVDHANLFFRVGGPIVSQKLVLGQNVKKGDVLMRLDDRDYRRQIEQISNSIEAEKAVNELAVKTLDRTQKLIENGYASKQRLDAAQSAKDASDAKIKSAEAALKIARDKLADTYLKAPFDGRITQLLAQENEVAQAYHPVAVLQNLSKLEAVVNLPESAIPAVGLREIDSYVGKMFTVTFPSRDNYQIKAKLTDMAPSAAGARPTYELRFRFNQPKDFLILPDMTAEVALPTGKNTNGVFVPFSAVFYREAEPFVGVYNPKTRQVKLVPVKIGAVFDNQSVEISDGVSAGDFVVAAGGGRFVENAAVSVMNPEVLSDVRD